MDAWDPSFCELLFEPIPEDVLSLVDELPSTSASELHTMSVHSMLDCM